MAKPKKSNAKEIVEEVETKVETKETKSEAYLSFEKFIEEYAKSNPTKYESKKEELLAKLNSLR